MLRRIVGITGISLWAGLIVVAVVGGLEGKANGEQIETMAKDFIQLLADSDFSKAAENFDAAMKKAAPPEKLRQIWNSLVTQHGQFEKQLDTRMKTILLYKAVFVACQFEKMVVDLQVTFDTANQIAGFHIAQIRPKANQQ